jgi:ATP-dependent exoDNAse (exonuclease V) beta subunit
VARAAWRDERAALLARAARPAPVFAPSSLERLEPFDWDDEAGAAAPPLAAASEPGADGSPPSAAGARARALALGTAVHAVLETVSLDDDAGLDDLAAAAAVRAGLPDQAAQIAALARACWRATPLRAAAGARHERELPVCVVRDGVTIEGAIDLVYRDAASGAWTIVDYKTDAHPEPDAVFERYGGQAGAYALAFEAASGARIAAVDVLLAALPDARGAATVVHLPFDEGLRGLVAERLAAGGAGADGEEEGPQ